MLDLNEEQKRFLDKFSDMNSEIRSLLAETKKNINEIKEIEHNLNRIIDEKTIGFPWLSDAIAQYYEMRDLKIAEYLEIKFNPAISTATRVREIATEKRNIEKKFRITRNLIKYYESLFSWLPEFVGEDLDVLSK